MMKGVATWCVAAMLVALVTAAVQETAPEDCNPEKLSPCLGAIKEGKDPSAECCSTLKEQQPCFCEFLKDPALKHIIESPDAKKVADACGVIIPTC